MQVFHHFTVLHWAEGWNGLRICVLLRLHRSILSVRNQWPLNVSTILSTAVSDVVEFLSFIWLYHCTNITFMFALNTKYEAISLLKQWTISVRPLWDSCIGRMTFVRWNWMRGNFKKLTAEGTSHSFDSTLFIYFFNCLYKCLTTFAFRLFS